MNQFSIHAVTTDPKYQPYLTSGLWFWRGHRLCVSINAQRNNKYAFLIAMHEIIEAFMCKHAGISDNTVTKWDMAFEDKRKPGDESEPGDHPKAPYRKQHKFAERIEKLLCKELGLDWDNYLKGIK